MNVYEKALERIDFMFENFENIYISFSGGKDSGVCTHLILEEARKRNRKVGLLHIDIEACFQKTHQYIEKVYEDYKDIIIPIWICLPMTTDNGLSNIDNMWTWWERGKEEKWVRKIPEKDFIIDLNKNPFNFYKENMTFEDFILKFAKNYSKIYGEPGKTACVVGIRTQESFRRWRAIYIKEKMYLDKKYTTQVYKDVYNFYPIYDWKTEDIWIYLSKYNKFYNEIYDLMYQAGIGINKMRIDEPFGCESKVGLNMFRVLEPETWSKVVGRVAGANRANIYNEKELNKNKYELPDGYTWRAYTEFLLSTLPKSVSDNYRDRFEKFIKWWKEKGSPLEAKDIQMLEKNYPGLIVNTHTYSNRTNRKNEVVVFNDIVDTIPELDTRIDVLSWKRMACAILKNDHCCKTLSFGLTKAQLQRRNELVKKYHEML